MSRQDRRRRMRIVRRKIGAFLLPLLAPPLLRVLSGSWKIERLGEEHFARALRAPGRLATLWHGRMLVGMRAHRDVPLDVLVSPSDDGSLVTVLLERFGFGTVRGSSNKNPARALRAILARLEQGATIVITPDGPRGPRHRVNPGPAWLARATGLPIVPCGFVCDRSWNLRSWDHFTIPKFGARVALVYGEPIDVPEATSDEELAAISEHVRESMLDAERRGFAHLGREPDF